MTVADMTPLELYGVVLAAILMAASFFMFLRYWRDLGLRHRFFAGAGVILVGIVPILLGADAIRHSTISSLDKAPDSEVTRLRYDPASGDLIRVED